jgi:hypothetical protein
MEDFTSPPSYCVRRDPRRGGSTIIARGFDSLGEAAEVALRLTRYQPEVGGDDDFYAEAE